MKIHLFRHLWGVSEPWERAIPRAKQQGYVGIECPLPSLDQQSRLMSLLSESELSYIAMAFTSGRDVGEHVRSLQEQVARASEMKAIKLTVHGGSDAWSVGQAREFYADAVEIERQSGMTLAHETHRGRVLFNPWATRDLLTMFPSMKLCCDFSHWVNVAERLDWDDETKSILSLCASRCAHLHARVGYAEGPQVPDPSAPEYANELAAHESWWDTIVATQRAAGATSLTVTPEFGPPGYLHTLPHTNVPVADLSQVVEWMAQRLRRRYDPAR
jgi:hypothetical protein